jgi:tRNA threonylcarbamoyladenosine biosynthesis protein TsaB
MGSVALGDEDKLLAERMIAVQATHSETVLPEIERVLDSCGRRVDEIGAIVVGAGPGSFTGVRIAASFAKGMAFGLGARLYAYSSLAAIAVGTGTRGRVCAILDARRGQLYAAGYDLSPAGIRELRPPTATTLVDLLGWIGAVRQWSFAGMFPPGAAAQIEALGGTVLSRGVGTPRASSLLWLARIVPNVGFVDRPRCWEPEYCRLPAAERERRR